MQPQPSLSVFDGPSHRVGIGISIGGGTNGQVDILVCLDPPDALRWALQVVAKAKAAQRAWEDEVIVNALVNDASTDVATLMASLGGEIT